MNLMDYVRVIQRHLFVIVLTTVISVTVAIVGSLWTQPTYRAIAKLHVSTATSGGSDWVDLDLKYSDRLMNTYAQIAMSDPVLDELATRLDLVDLLPEIDAAVVPDTELMKITVVADEPDLAANVANSLAGILIERGADLSAQSGIRMRQALATQIAQLESELAQDRVEFSELQNDADGTATEIIDAARKDLDSKERLYESLLELNAQRSIQAAILATSLSIIDPADEPLAPYQPKIVLNVLLGLLVGMIGGVGLAFLLENLEQSSSARLDTETMEPTDSPATPVSDNPQTLQNGRMSRIGNQNVVEERAWHELRSKVLIGIEMGALQSLLTTSTEPVDAKTRLVIKLAKSASEEERHVVIVDCDPSSVQLQSIFRDTADRSLADVLQGTCTLEEAVYPTSFPQISIVSAGVARAGLAENLDSPIMTDILRQLRAHYDLILLDAPAFFDTATAASMASMVDGVLLVNKSDKVAGAHPLIL